MRVGGALLSLVLAACTASADLTVDLRTDFVAGVEIDEARTTLEGRSPVVARLGVGDALGRGARIAELADVAHGTHRLRVELLRAGAVVYTRPVLVTLDAARVVTVVVSRSCRDVACAADEACVGGECRSERCVAEASGDCGAPQCASAAACPDPAGACAAAACEEGVCLVEGAGCAMGEYCDPDRGCRPLEGPLDGGVDAAVPDAGAPDAAMPDAGEAPPCTWPLAGINAGPRTTCAWSATDTWCWGNNDDGQLQIDPEDLPDRTRPEPLPSHAEYPWAPLVQGDDHVCAVGAASETLFCWGTNYAGQLGLDPGAVAIRLRPVETVTGAIDRGRGALAAGGAHSCVRRPTQEMLCWGDNQRGQVGTGSPASVVFPATVVSTGWSFVDGGGDFSCGVWGGNGACWGDNNNQTLGRPPPDETAGSRVPVALGFGWVEMAAGYSMSCGIRELGVDDDALYCWGGNWLGQLGAGYPGGGTWEPQEVVGAARWASLSVYEDFGCAIGEDTSLWCWGDNSRGQIGRPPGPGPEPHVDPAVEIGGLGWIEVTTGRNHVCALRRYPGATAPSLYCWGGNADGQLGLGDRTDRHAPTPVCPP